MHLILHTSRCKAFVGSRESAIAMAKLDNNQFFIQSINYYKGYAHVRRSTIFNVTFEDGEVIDVPYSADLASSEQFPTYINSVSELYPLRYSAAQAKKQIAMLNKLAITDFSIGDTFYLSLRYFDGIDSVWYDNLRLPEPSKQAVVECRILNFKGQRQSRIMVQVVILNKSYVLGNYEMTLYAKRELNQVKMVLVKIRDKEKFSSIWKELL